MILLGTHWKSEKLKFIIAIDICSSLIDSHSAVVAGRLGTALSGVLA